MVEQIFLSPHVTRSVIINNRLVCVCVCVCLCVCLCVCVCMCLYSSTVKASCVCKMSDTCLRGTDQRCYVVSILRCASAKFLHLSIRKCHISPPKTKTPVTANWRENEYDIYCHCQKMIY